MIGDEGSRVETERLTAELRARRVNTNHRPAKVEPNRRFEVDLTSTYLKFFVTLPSVRGKTRYALCVPRMGRMTLRGALPAG